MEVKDLLVCLLGATLFCNFIAQLTKETATGYTVESVRIHHPHEGGDMYMITIRWHILFWRRMTNCYVGRNGFWRLATTPLDIVPSDNTSYMLDDELNEYLQSKDTEAN